MHGSASHLAGLTLLSLPARSYLPQPLSVTVGGTAIARCAVPKTVPSRRHVVSFVIQGVTLTFDILGQQREEALATIYLILFVIGGIVLLSLTLSESVDRQARFPA